MVGEKIEFYGEQMTLDAIAKKEGIKRDTLEVHYKKTRYLFSSKI